MKNLLMTTIAIFGLALISNAQVPNYVPSNGLVGWWPFNGNANDESGSGIDGIPNGPILTTDRFGNNDASYSFDGGGEHINTNYEGILGQNARTFSMWFLSEGNINGSSLLFYGLNNIGSRVNIYLGYVENTGNVAYIDNSNSAISYNPIIPFGSWNHLVYTYDSIDGQSTSDFKLYINGTLTSSIYSNYNGDQSLFTQAGETLTFGSVIGQELVGKMDDIGIWNRALTQEEITSLYLGSSLGFNEVSELNLFSVFPNPAQSEINVNINSKLVGSAFTIYDNIGKAVKSGKLNSANANIELNDLSDGIYTLSVGENKKQIFKVIKE